MFLIETPNVQTLLLFGYTFVLVERCTLHTHFGMWLRRHCLLTLGGKISVIKAIFLCTYLQVIWKEHSYLCVLSGIIIMTNKYSSMSWIQRFCVCHRIWMVIMFDTPSLFGPWIFVDFACPADTQHVIFVTKFITFSVNSSDGSR